MEQQYSESLPSERSWPGLSLASLKVFAQGVAYAFAVAALLGVIVLLALMPE
jgi:hypothetical protein